MLAVGLDLAKTSRERKLLFPAQRLIREDHDMVSEKRLDDRVPQLWRQWL
jgi:hypothetical protein